MATNDTTDFDDQCASPLNGSSQTTKHTMIKAIELTLSNKTVNIILMEKYGGESSVLIAGADALATAVLEV